VRRPKSHRYAPLPLEGGEQVEHGARQPVYARRNDNEIGVSDRRSISNSTGLCGIRRFAQILRRDTDAVRNAIS
jgi:hypothetical protein